MTTSPDQLTIAVEPLVLTQRIEAPPEVVFDHLVDPEKILRWMGRDVVAEARPGGRFWIDVNGNDEAEGNYTVVDRPSTLEFTWGWIGSTHVPPGSTTVRFELRAVDDATLVTLTHNDLPMGPEDAHREGWTYFLGRLAVAGTGADPGPDMFHDDSSR